MRCSSPSRMNESTISWGRRTCWVRSRWHPFCKERVESKFSSMREHLWIRIRNQKNITVYITLPTGCRLLRATHSEPWTQMEKEASYLGSLPVETKFKRNFVGQLLHASRIRHGCSWTQRSSTLPWPQCLLDSKRLARSKMGLLKRTTSRSLSLLAQEALFAYGSRNQRMGEVL